MLPVWASDSFILSFMLQAFTEHRLCLVFIYTGDTVVNRTPQPLNSGVKPLPGRFLGFQ